MSDTTPDAEVALPTTLSRWTRVPGILFAVLVGVLAVTLTYVAVIGVQNQFKQVAVMEQSHRVYESDLADRFDKIPAVVSFASDPVFDTPEWKTVLDENRKIGARTGTLDPRTFGIWWPGLDARAEKVLPTVYDHSEFVIAAGTALGSCHDTALSVDQRIAQWQERYINAVGADLKNDPYWQAKLAAMPDVIRAGTKYFCNPKPLKS